MILHVACLPFPSHQGTQAAIDSMLRAWSASGCPAHLLTYAHGCESALDAPYRIHRVPDFPRVRSLRSGPSWGKVALDAACVASTRALARRLRPRALVAHHIEAAMAALVADVAPVYYVAHTSLAHELPIYFPRLPRQAVSALGRAAERSVCARAQSVAAVAPSLAQLLPNARHLAVPWPSAVASPPKGEARAALDLPANARLCLYAGNLDRYQGWEHLLEALQRLRRVEKRARLLIATESDTTPARRAANLLGITEAVEFRGLSSERDRSWAHAAADVAWVPRRTEGGLPIKMLDALSRGVPVLAMDRATAGLPIDDACVVVPNDDPGAVAASSQRIFGDALLTATLRERGFDYLAWHHSAPRYVDAMHDWLGTPSSRTTATRPAPRPQAAPARQAR